MIPNTCIGELPAGVAVLVAAMLVAAILAATRLVGAPRRAAVVPALGLILVLASALAAAPVIAAVPHESAVPAYSTEQSLLQIEQDAPEPGWLSKDSGRVHKFRSTIGPAFHEESVIVQRGGNTWRTLRNGPIAFWSAVLLLAAPVGIALFHFVVGPMRLQSTPTGRDVLRFTSWQRYLHRANAISFVALAISGLLVTFGKVTLLPLIGHDAFSKLMYATKYVHNFVGPLFVLLSILMFFTFVRDNLWKRYDLAWFKGMGGFLSHKHISTGKFNAGEKMWFWFGVVLLGLAVSASGILLDFVVFGQTRYIQQLANYTHLVAAVLYMAAALGHIYVGLWGVEGARRGMREGLVDEAWAREHHEYWYQDIQRRRGEPVDPRAAVAPGPAMRPRG